VAAAHGAWRWQWQRQPHEKLRGVWGSGSAQCTKQGLACCPGSGDDLNGDGMDSMLAVWRKEEELSLPLRLSLSPLLLSLPQNPQSKVFACVLPLACSVVAGRGGR
jgi:hypothetical protein